MSTKVMNEATTDGKQGQIYFFIYFYKFIYIKK